MRQKEGKSMDQPHRLHPVGTTRSPQYNYFLKQVKTIKKYYPKTSYFDCQTCFLIFLFCITEIVIKKITKHTLNYFITVKKNIEGFIGCIF